MSKELSHSFLDFEHLECSTERDIVQSLNNHPWVKIKINEDAPNMTSYTLNIKAYNRWLKTEEGKEYGTRGCGDDAIYTASIFLRKYMSRGFSVYEDKNDFFVFRGFLKFTGLQSSDEDEQSSATNHTESFLYEGKRLTDCTHFICTEKSNGENGKWAIRRCNDGSFIIAAGSKNAMKVWKRGETPTFTSDTYLPVVEICNWVSKYCSTATDDFFENVATNQWTIMFEINHPDSEHIFRINEMRMDFVSILDEKGIPIDCTTAFNFFSKNNLTHVPYSQHSPSELDSVIDVTRKRIDTEGSVIYLYEEDKCIGLIKLKSDFYVVARAIRECFKHFIRLALSGDLIDGPVPNKGNRKKSNKSHKMPITIKEAFDNVSERIQKRMRNLSHLENYDIRSTEWIDTGLSFLSYWSNHYYSLTTNDEKIDYIRMTEKKYGTLYEEALLYRTETICLGIIGDIITSL